MKSSEWGTEELTQSIFENTSDGILISDLETGKVLAANPAVAEMHGYTRAEFMDLRIVDFLHPMSRSGYTDYASTIRQSGQFEMLARHIRKDGSSISIDWRAVAFNFQGQVRALAILRDVSKRVRAEHQLRLRVGARSIEQATLLEISQTLASTLELQPDLILDQLGVLIKYTHAALFTLEDSTLIALAARGKEKLEESMPLRVRLNGKDTLGKLFNGHLPIRIADIWGNEPTAEFLRNLLKNGSAVLLEGVQSWMWVPLAVKKQFIGGIGIAHAERGYFTSHHANLAMTIANQAAMTLVNMELYEHAQELAVLQERQRLAQNLHDAVNQSLFSAGLIAEVLPRLWERDPDTARHSLEDLRRLTRGAMAEMRALLAELRPATLIDTEIGDLLLLLGNAFTGRTNIPVDMMIIGKGSLPAETQVALYRICQEVLNNIAKHAKASQVRIDLNHKPDELDLHISDNGQGFVTSELTPSGHYGLTMMRERAEAVGAKLTITSQRRKGTEVAIHWVKKEDL